MTAGESWVEITPTSGSEVGIVQTIEADIEAPVRWDGEPNRYIVCTGGPDLAVQCDTRYLEPADPLPVSTDDGLPVAGRVWVGDKPAAAATVTVFPEELEARRPFVLPLFFQKDTGLVRAVRSDPEGKFRLPTLAPGRYQMELTTASGRRQLSDPFAIPSRHAREEEQDDQIEAMLDLGDLRLPVGLTMQVSVLTPNGQPIEKARLIANQGTGVQDRISFFGATDAQGLGLLREIQPDAPVQVRCEARGFTPHQERFPVPPDSVLCVLRPLARIRGTVLGGGEPVPQATIATLLPPAFPGAARQTRTVMTNEEGEFEIADLTPRPYSLTAAAPGYRAQQVQVELNSGEEHQLEPVELILAEERLLRIVNGSDQQPLPGAEIIPVEPPGLAQGVTDENGEAVLALGGGDAVTLRISAAGFPPAIFELPADPPPSGEADEFAMHRGGSILIQAWTGTGEPCAGCDVVFYRPGGEPLALSTKGLKTDSFGEVRTDILSAGTYHVALEEARSVGGVVSVRSGHNLKIVEVRPSEVTAVIFGQPTRTIGVQFWPPPPPGWNLRVATSQGIEVYEPAADGMFIVRQRPDESLTLRLTREGISVAQAILPATFDEPHLRIDLPETAVQGQVESGEGPLDVRLQSVTTPGISAWTVTAPGGTFLIPFLPPGAYILEIQGRPTSTVTLAAGNSQDLGVLSLP